MNYPHELVDQCRYTSSDKEAHRRGGALGFRGYNTDSIFLMPYLSDEAWYVQQLAEFRDDQFLLVEAEERISWQLRTCYPNMSVMSGRLHDVIRVSDRIFSAGHADFIGNINSCNYTNKTSTWTFDLIEALAERAAPVACFAFTHKKDIRAGSKIMDSYTALVHDVLDEGQRRSLGVNFCRPIEAWMMNTCQAFHPTTLIALKFYSVFGNTRQIQIETAFDYLSSVDNDGRPQRLKMNKTTVSLDRGQTDLEGLLKNVREILER